MGSAPGGGGERARTRRARLARAVAVHPGREGSNSLVRTARVHPLRLGPVVALDVGQCSGVLFEVLLLLAAVRAPMGAVEERAALADALGERAEVDPALGGGGSRSDPDEGDRCGDAPHGY